MGAQFFNIDVYTPLKNSVAARAPQFFTALNLAAYTLVKNRVGIEAASFFRRQEAELVVYFKDEKRSEIAYINLG